MDDIQGVILDGNVSSQTDSPCGCGSGLRRLFRCTDCASAPPSCSRCIVHEHSHLPFHKIEEWTGSHFRATSLCALGLRICLMHDGQPCPSMQDTYDGTLCVVAHINGIHKIRVLFCSCQGHPPKLLQLVQAKLFPGTVDEPRSLFTFAVLKDFHLHTCVSKRAAYDYMRALRRKSDAAMLGDASVSTQ